jgi:hypothetical protein
MAIIEQASYSSKTRAAESVVEIGIAKSAALKTS